MNAFDLDFLSGFQPSPPVINQEIGVLVRDMRSGECCRH